MIHTHFSIRRHGLVVFLVIIGMLGAARMAISCSSEIPHLVVVTPEIGSDDAILLRVSPKPERFLSHHAIEFSLQSADGKKTPAHIDLVGRGGFFISLRPDKTLPPGEYKIQVADPAHCDSDSPSCHNDFIFREEYLKFRVMNSLSLKSEDHFTVEEVEITNDSCNSRRFKLRAEPGQTSKNQPYLVQFFDGAKDHYFWQFRNNNSGMTIYTGIGSNNFQLEFGSEGEFVIYRYETGSLTMLGAWRYKIPLPEGWTAIQFKALNDCQRDALNKMVDAAHHGEFLEENVLITNCMSKIRPLPLNSRLFNEATSFHAVFTPAQAGFEPVKDTTLHIYRKLSDLKSKGD